MYALAIAFATSGNFRIVCFKTHFYQLRVFHRCDLKSADKRRGKIDRYFFSVRLCCLRKMRRISIWSSDLKRDVNDEMLLFIG